MAVYLIKGSDSSLVRAKAIELVDRLVGDGDRSMMVDEFDGEEYELREVADAAQTLPFLTDLRVVVARDIGRFTLDDSTALINYLSSPLETTELVLVSGGGKTPKKVLDAIAAAGAHVVDTSPPRRVNDRPTWVRAEAAERGVTIDGGAAARIADQLGEDMGRLDGLIAVLRSTFGDGVQLRAPDIEPFLGDAGGVPPWDLTDAIDTGKTPDALAVLRRMIHGGDRHPLQVMAILHKHYANLACLDGVDARTDKDAADAIGIKPGYPAKKALNNYRRLGGAKVRQAITWLADADRDLRGETGLDAETVMDILVARLSRLSRR